jgi:translocator protein
MEISSVLVLLGFIAACFLAALTGAVFRPGDWYERLIKPSWRPPNQLFAPVWSVLYLMIAVSGWLIWREAGFVGTTLPLEIYALLACTRFRRHRELGVFMEPEVSHGKTKVYTGVQA